jgi:hypothetical protein
MKTVLMMHEGSVCISTAYIKIRFLNFSVTQSFPEGLVSRKYL